MDFSWEMAAAENLARLTKHGGLYANSDLYQEAQKILSGLRLKTAKIELGSRLANVRSDYSRGLQLFQELLPEWDLDVTSSMKGVGGTRPWVMLTARLGPNELRQEGPRASEALAELINECLEQAGNLEG